VTQASTEDLPLAAPAVAPRRLGLMFATALIALALDQATKAVAAWALAGDRTIPLLGHWLQLRLVRNPGAAFSMGESLTWVFTVLATLVVIGAVWSAPRVRSRYWAFTLGLLVAGAAGNLADRLFRPPAFGRGHVVDFIDYAGRFVGNVADIAIVAAMVLMMVGVFRGVGLDGARR
jgi:signal peptidase II